MQLRSLAVSAALIGSLLFAPAVCSAQQPVFFDGFLADNAAQPANDFNFFFLWNVTEGFVDLVQDDPNDVIFGRYVDLAGSSRDPGRFATRNLITLLPNVEYTLSFDFKNTGGTTNTASVTLGSLNFDVTATSSTFQSFSRDFSFSTPTNAELVFQDLDVGVDNFGVGIDNVMIAPRVVVPAPSSLAAILIGAVPVSVLAFRRRRK